MMISWRAAQDLLFQTMMLPFYLVFSATVVLLSIILFPLLYGYYSTIAVLDACIKITDAMIARDRSEARRLYRELQHNLKDPIRIFILVGRRFQLRR